MDEDKKLPEVVFANKDALKAFIGNDGRKKIELIANKKLVHKICDPFQCNYLFVDNKGAVIKANNNSPVDTKGKDYIKVKVIINTTNLFDRHKDVHMENLYNKSLIENKMLMHLRQHNMDFEYIIANGKDLKAYTQKFSWMQLGYPYQGFTQAVVFESVVRLNRNKYMFEQYASGYVENHSAGMQYVTMVLCVDEPNDDDYGAEYEAWQKYFPLVANADAAQESGYFWAVKEAKLIEGSAVPIGSNWITPTLDNNMEKSEPGNHSEAEPLLVNTRKDLYSYLSKNLKF